MDPIRVLVARFIVVLVRRRFVRLDQIKFRFLDNLFLARLRAAVRRAAFARCARRHPRTRRRARIIFCFIHHQRQPNQPSRFKHSPDNEYLPFHNDSRQFQHFVSFDCQSGGIRHTTSSVAQWLQGGTAVHSPLSSASLPLLAARSRSFGAGRATPSTGLLNKLSNGVSPLSGRELDVHKEDNSNSPVEKGKKESSVCKNIPKASVHVPLSGFLYLPQLGCTNKRNKTTRIPWFRKLLSLFHPRILQARQTSLRTSQKGRNIFLEQRRTNHIQRPQTKIYDRTHTQTFPRPPVNRHRIRHLRLSHRCRLLSITSSSYNQRSIRCISRTLSPAECNYDVHDKEMLAIVFACIEWRALLLSLTNNFEILTNHRALEYFMTTKILNRCQVRWAGRLVARVRQRRPQTSIMGTMGKCCKHQRIYSRLSQPQPHETTITALRTNPNFGQRMTTEGRHLEKA